MNKFVTRIEVKPDGLFSPDVGEWSHEKYKLVGSYCDIFTRGMKKKWDELVYIDLFAGSGYSQIGKKTFLNAALLAMSIPDSFTKYILCEKDEKKIKALSERVKRNFSHLNCELVHGDSNANVEKIISNIPKGKKMLSFCFVDPYSLDLNFDTIQKLGTLQTDFLILQALHMDGNRNFDKYIKGDHPRIEKYLGLKNWREKFEKDNGKNSNDFIKFLAEQYSDQMSKLGYLKEKLMHSISTDQNLQLYYLSFYSKHERGKDFFKKVSKRVTPQTSFDF